MKTAVFALVACLAASPAAAAPHAPRLASVRTFALALGDGAANADLAGYDLVVVDGDTPAKRVMQLRAGGAIVLGYLDVGTIEPYRSWYAAAKPYRLDYWPDWGEWYANVAKPGFRNLLAGRIAPAILRRGFDGLFLDNVDEIESHHGQRAGMRALVRRLAKLRGYLFAQNGDDIIAPFLPALDGWNREDVSRTYDFATKRYVAVSAADRREAEAELRRVAAPESSSQRPTTRPRETPRPPARPPRPPAPPARSASSATSTSRACRSRRCAANAPAPPSRRCGRRRR